VSSPKTRSGRFMEAVGILRQRRELSDVQALTLCGSAPDAEELLRLLALIGFLERAGPSSAAGKLADDRLSSGQLSAVESYVMGSDEAADWVKLIDSMGPSSEPHSPEPAGRGAVVDPEVAARYAKGFIDVSDIASRQKVGKR
jgi:hypothetical protein